MHLSSSSSLSGVHLIANGDDDKVLPLLVCDVRHLDKRNVVVAVVELDQSERSEQTDQRTQMHFV